MSPKEIVNEVGEQQKSITAIFFWHIRETLTFLILKDLLLSILNNYVKHFNIKEEKSMFIYITHTLQIHISNLLWTFISDLHDHINQK